MTFFIGVDLHKTQFTVHVRTEEESESLDQIKQYPTSPDGYAEFLARISRYKATGADVKVGVESTGNTRYFKNQVEKALLRKLISMMLQRFQNFFQRICFRKAIFVEKRQRISDVC